MAAWAWPFWLAGGVLSLLAIAVMYWALFADRPGGRRRCQSCWYDMAGIPSLPCPECGRTAKRERQLLRAKRRPIVALLGSLVLAAGLAVGYVPWLAGAPWVTRAPRPVLIAGMYIYASADASLRNEFDRRRDASPQLLETQLSGFEVWCVRKTAVRLINKQTLTLSAQPSYSNRNAPWWQRGGPLSDADRPGQWLLWLGTDAKPAVDDLIGVARSRMDPTARYAALALMVELGHRPQDVLSACRSIAGSTDDGQVRATATSVIGLLGGPGDKTGSLIRRLLFDPDSRVRSAALQVLGPNLPSTPDAADDVAKAVAAETVGPIRHLGVSYLVHVESRCGDFRGQLEAMLRNDDYPPARAGALFALSVCVHDKATLRRLAAEAASDPDDLVRMQAARILSRLDESDAPSQP